MKRNYIISIVGLLIIVLIAYKLSANKKKIDEKKNKSVEATVRIPVKVATAKEELLELSMIKTGSIE